MRMASKKPLYALVKWVEDDTYTPNVPIAWIKYSNYDDYKSDEFYPFHVYTIEWRDTKKEPKGGWVCFDGIVIDVSDKMKTLERKLDVINGALSPKNLSVEMSTKEVSTVRLPSGKCPNIIDEDEMNLKIKKPKLSTHYAGDDKLSDSDKISQASTSTKSYPNEFFTPQLLPKYLRDKKAEIEKRRFTKIKNLSSSSDDDDVHISNVKIDEPRFNRKKVKNDSTNGTLNKENKNIQQTLSSKVIESDVKPKNRNFMNQNLLQEKTTSNAQEITLKVVYEAVMQTQAMIRNLHAYPAKAESKNPVKAIALSHSDEPEVRVEIQPGSGVTVSDEEWKRARKRPTFTAMGLSLLTMIFDYKVLLRSNLKGGSRKVKTENAGPVYQALDSRKLAAIMYAVEKKHPSDFKESLMGSVINTKLNSMRANMKIASTTSAESKKKYMKDQQSSEELIDKKHDSTEEEDDY